jgi:hypothetical protein
MLRRIKKIEEKPLDFLIGRKSLTQQKRRQRLNVTLKGREW